VSVELALKMIDIWLVTPFDGGRHARRVQKIADIESASGRAGRTAKKPSGGRSRPTQPQ
jgi:ribose 5-phosphate isomerase B